MFRHSNYSLDKLIIEVRGDHTRSNNKDKHIAHFDHLLGNKGHDARTMIIEEGYTDLQYLQEYGAFYATSFASYEKTCKRLHFFKATFSEEEFNKTIANSEVTTLSTHIWSSYLGFITVKPVKDKLIGTTIIKPPVSYDSERGYCFPANRPYEIDIAGKKIGIESMVFQEQDGLISSCASVTLWAALSKMAHLFQIKHLTPLEMNYLVNKRSLEIGPDIHDNGLDDEEIIDLINSRGLGCEYRANKDLQEKDLNALKALIYAYLESGLPVLLGIRIKREDEDSMMIKNLAQDLGEPEKGFIEGEEQTEEEHLIVINGYENCLGKGEPDVLSLRPHRISTFFIHDDQNGPYSNLVFEEDEVKLIGRYIDYPEGTWEHEETVRENIVERTDSVKIVSIIIPIHDLFRLKFEDVRFYSKKIDMALTEGQDMEGSFPWWDIYYANQDQLKENIRSLQINPNSASANTRMKLNILREPLPPFVWVARAYIRKTLILQVIFDATTSSPKNPNCIQVSIFNEEIVDLIEDDFRRRGEKQHKEFFTITCGLEGNFYEKLLEAKDDF